MSRAGTDKTFGATLGALNAELRFELNSAAGIRIDARGVFVATFVLEATQDGINWVNIQTQGSGLTSLPTVGNNSFNSAISLVSADLAGFVYARVRCSAYTSGAAVIDINLTEDSLIELVGVAGPVTNSDNIWYQESVAAQAASATVTGTARDTGAASGSNHRYAAFNAYAFADVAGSMRIEVSNDGVTWRRASADAAVAANTAVIMSVPVVARYFRAVYINGATLQTAFMLNTSLTVA